MNNNQKIYCRILSCYVLYLTVLLIIFNSPIFCATDWYVDVNSGDTANDGLSAVTAKKNIRNIIGWNGVGSLTADDTINIATGVAGYNFVNRLYNWRWGKIKIDNY